MPIDVQGDGGAAGSSGSVVPGSVHTVDTVMVTANGDVIDAATVSAVDGIYGIYFQFTLPKTDWRAEIIKVSASNYASYIQQIGGHDHVTAAWYAQDTNAQGLLTDNLIVQVATDDGASTSEVEIPFKLLNTPAAFARIDKAYDTMNKIQAIT